MEIQGASWTLYEFCRALCRIQQDEAFRSGQPSDAARKQRIVAGFAVAARYDCSAEAFRDEPVVRR